MDNIYTIDATSDVIRGGENLGTRNIIKDLTVLEVKALIEENTQKFGRPRFLAGMILWINDSNDTFCFSIYKNNEAFNITSLDDIVNKINNPQHDLLMKELAKNSLSSIQGILQGSVSQFHLSKGNINGATILLGEGLGRIKTRTNTDLGIDLKSFCKSLEDLLKKLQFKEILNENDKPFLQILGNKVNN